MVHLEYRFNQEPFCIPVVADHAEDLTDDTTSRLTLDMDNEIDRISDLSLGIYESGLGMASHHQIGEAMESLFGRVGMDRSQRSCVAGIEGVEQRSRLDSADFSENDPVRTPAKCRLQKIVKCDPGLEGIGLAFDSENVRLLD